jgi:hypothetical protein
MSGRRCGGIMVSHREVGMMVASKRATWLRRKRRRSTQVVSCDDERASGEEAIAGHEASAAEATPSHMNRLKTFRL